MFPDLLISFNPAPEVYHDSNGYVISEQSKPPDFVMEIASRSTGREHTRNKRTWYARLGLPEYWWFDQTGGFHGSRPAGDRLADGRYEPILIETMEDGILQCYSALLNLFIRWENGERRGIRWRGRQPAPHPGVFIGAAVSQVIGISPRPEPGP